MQISSRLLLKTAVVMLGLMLITGLVVLSSYTRQANATTQSEWQQVAGFIDSYLTSQYVDDSTDGDESGYLVLSDTAAGSCAAGTMKKRVDSNCDGTYAGIGDDMADMPVIYDVLNTGSNYVPGTAHYPSGGANYTADATQVNTVRTKVERHEKGDMSTEIVLVCATGHVQSAPTMAIGAISKAGYFSSATPTPPEVRGLKWGVSGWAAVGSVSLATAATGTATTVDPSNSLTDTSLGSDGCTGAIDVVTRCRAEKALKTGDIGGVAISSKPANTANIGATSKTVDIRPVPSSTTTVGSIGGSALPVMEPFNTLFKADTDGNSVDDWDNLKKLDPTTTNRNLFINRTQHTAGMIAEGAAMLGYKAAFVSWGLPGWNSSVFTEDRISTPSPGESMGYAKYARDTASPAVSSVSSGIPGSTSATITWSTSDTGCPTAPCGTTSLVQYGIASGVYPSKMTDTVLTDGSRSIGLTGLTPSTLYYYKVTSYDAAANEGTATEGTFTTAAATPTDTTPPVTTDNAPVGWQNADVTVTLSCSDGGGSGCNNTYYQVNGGGYVTGTSVLISTEGTSTIDYYSDDLAVPTNTETPVNSATVQLDKTDPSTSDDYTGVGWQTSPVTVNFTCTDQVGLSGCDFTEYSLDSGATWTTGGSVTLSSSGTYSVWYRSQDNAGNMETIQTEIVQLDLVGPSVINILPTGTTGSTVTVSADYSDADSGIDTSTVVVKVDSVTVGGCVVGGTSVSCLVAGLANGPHTIDVYVDDLAGNSGSGSGGFTVATCASGKPSLPLSLTSAYWALGWPDFSAGTVTVDWTINNTGANDAYDVRITGSSPSSPVLLLTGMDVVYGFIPASSGGMQSIKYDVSSLLGSSFTVTNTGTAEDQCGTLYSYPPAT